MTERKKPVAARIDRKVWERTEQARLKALEKQNYAAMSPMSWVSYLLSLGLDAIKESE